MPDGCLKPVRSSPYSQSNTHNCRREQHVSSCRAVDSVTVKHSVAGTDCVVCVGRKSARTGCRIAPAVVRWLRAWHVCMVSLSLSQVKNILTLAALVPVIQFLVPTRKSDQVEGRELGALGRLRRLAVSRCSHFPGALVSQRLFWRRLALTSEARREHSPA